MGLIFFGCQSPFFTKSSNCVHGLCRDGMCSDTLELEVDLHLLKSVFKGLQVHRCTESFKYFWDSVSIHIYYKHKHMLPKLCVNKCKIYENSAENSQALDRRKTTYPNSRNSTAAVAVLSNLHLYFPFQWKIPSVFSAAPKASSSKNITGIVQVMLLQFKNHSNTVQQLLHPETLTLNPVIFCKHSAYTPYTFHYICIVYMKSSLPQSG